MKRVLSSELQQYEKSPNPANRTIISTTTKQTLKSDAVQFENSVKVDNLQSNGRKLKGTVKPRKRECSDCGKLFANLEQHIKIVHKKIKNFECVNCKRRFYDNRELRNHEFQSLLAGQCRQSNRDGKFFFLFKIKNTEKCNMVFVVCSHDSLKLEFRCTRKGNTITVRGE